ncbi:arylsulfatase [Microbacterium nanhaiense]|uniref:Arylsulfatase n=1 Tax=Microbacterium nanhaiense TaxID=1301026 RepID=A0ABQ2N3E6_9MICO|nr:aspartate/glutamate racemase family protein [Microbacterium nanhaiense]GGO65177.1 arylsulfatase [Microbacterium nanhaiense]
MTRIAFLHTGAVVIPPVMALAGELLPDATPVNYLDDKIVADLRDPELSGSVEGRLENLVRAAKDGGAELVMLTCSSISQLAGPLSERVGISVLRIDEAMADIAVATGPRIAVIATLPTTSEPTTALIRERAELAGRDPQISSEVVDGAFAAVASGDRDTHDRLVVAAIERWAGEVDVIVLAQASMASAAEAASVDVPVLTSLRPGIERLGQTLAA